MIRTDFDACIHNWATQGLNYYVLTRLLAHEVESGRRRALAMNVLFALMVPVGALLYLLLRGLVHAQSFTAFALAGSAGTFLHLALSDILPDLHRRQGSKFRLSGALMAGLAAMWSLTLLNHAH